MAHVPASRALSSTNAIRDHSVSGKITEDQLDLQRKFITERLETARADLDDLRARESVASEKRTMMENLIQWAGEFGDRLDELSDEKRRDVLRSRQTQHLDDHSPFAPATSLLLKSHKAAALRMTTYPRIY